MITFSCTWLSFDSKGLIRQKYREASFTSIDHDFYTFYSFFAYVYGTFIGRFLLLSVFISVSLMIFLYLSLSLPALFYFQLPFFSMNYFSLFLLFSFSLSFSLFYTPFLFSPVFVPFSIISISVVIPYSYLRSLF